MELSYLVWQTATLQGYRELGKEGRALQTRYSRETAAMAEAQYLASLSAEPEQS